MHVHDSAIQAAIFFAFIIILGAGWRIASARMAEKPLGQAMAFIY